MRVFSLFLAISLFGVLSYAADPQPTPFAKLAHEVNEALNKTSIAHRPPGASLDSLVQCRSQEMFDQARARFTEQDFQELSKNKCNEKLCIGDVTPFDATIKRAIERNEQRIKFLQAQLTKPISVETSSKIPATLGWDTWAKDDKELEERWAKLLTYDVIREMIKKNPANPETVDAEAVKALVIQATTTMLEERIRTWKTIPQTAKEELMLTARLTCTDKYARIIPKAQLQSSGNNAGLLDYPLTFGLKLVQDPTGFYIADTIPGSKASLDNQLEMGDKLVSAKVGGVKHDLTDQETKFFDTSFKEGTEIEMELERAGKRFTVKLPVERTIPYSSMVLYRDRIVNGKTFRVVSIPKFIYGDPKLSPKEDIATSTQVERALGRKGDYDAIVLDLRSNTGGAATEGSRLVGAFLSKKPNVTAILAEKTNEGEDGWQAAQASSKTPFSDKPLFVFHNRETGSASEIAMTALKDTKRAVFIGEPTYGKGIQQKPLPLSDGSLLMRTNAVNLGLTGDTFHLVGVADHLRVPYVPGTDPNLKETQKIDPPKVEKDKDLKMNYTGDYWQFDQAALDRTAAWSKQIQGSTPQIKAYYDSLKRLSDIRSNPNILLSLKDVQKVDRELRKEYRTADEMGGYENANSHPDFAMTTDWSLVLAGRYMDEAAAGKKK